MADTPDLKAIDAKMAKPPIDDGGPAFPTRWPRSDDAQYWTQDGMSLRDYFAAHALAGMCGGDEWPISGDGPEMSKRAYLFADAMLKARQS